MFHVDCRLGSGSYGKVFRARNHVGALFALKQSDLYEKDGEMLLGTIREYIFHNSMEPSEGLCIAQNMWTTKHFAFFVMPLYDANLLEFARQTRKSLHVDDFLHVAHRLARAVCRLHERGWMHRDIKPENVYLDAHGDLVLGDFNLARFCDSRHEGGHSQHKGSASTLVCTLWTRAPELVVADLQGRHVMESSFEVDAFSVGATLLTLCAGGYVFGKKVSSDSENQTQAFLDGYFSVAGTDSFVRAAYPTVDGLEHLPPCSGFAARLLEWLPNQWQAEDKTSIATVLAKLLDPVPARRASVNSVFSLPRSKGPTDAFGCLRKLERSSESFDVLSPWDSRPACRIPEVPAPPKSPQSLWSQLGNWNVPIPLALHAIRLTRTRSDAQPKALLFLLRAIHRFNFSDLASVDASAILDALPCLCMDIQLWSFARQIESQPFLVCCLAAWTFVVGTVPSSVLVLTSDEMGRVLQHNDVQEFFGSFGTRWKSQRSMLESWKRLDST